MGEEETLAVLALLPLYSSLNFIPHLFSLNLGSTASSSSSSLCHPPNPPLLHLREKASEIQLKSLLFTVTYILQLQPPQGFRLHFGCWHSQAPAPAPLCWESHLWLRFAGGLPLLCSTAPAFLGALLAEHRSTC